MSETGLFTFMTISVSFMFGWAIGWVLGYLIGENSEQSRWHTLLVAKGLAIWKVSVNGSTEFKFNDTKRGE